MHGLTSDYDSDVEQSFEERITQSTKMMKKYNDRVPIIISPKKNSITMSKRKFLPKKDSTLGSFIHFIKQYVDVNSRQSILAFANNTLIPISHTMGEIYKLHADSDGFLYIYITVENTFG